MVQSMMSTKMIMILGVSTPASSFSLNSGSAILHRTPSGLKNVARCNSDFITHSFNLPTKRFKTTNTCLNAILRDDVVSSSQLNAATLLESPLSLEETAEIDEFNPSIEKMEEFFVPAVPVVDIPKPDSSDAWKSNDFVFGLETSELKRQKGKKVATLVVEGDELDSKPFMVAMVASTLLTHAVVAAVSLSQIASNHGFFEGSLVSLVVACASWALSDLGSGIFHWSVDNYGNGRTPVLGAIIAAFQGHHSAPWTIADRAFCNNVHKLCIPFGIPTILAITFLFNPATSLFFSIFCAMEVMSQEFHKWSHMTKADAPAIVNVLQDAGVIIGRKAHGLHHVCPFDGNYCIVTGAMNPFLDGSGLLRMLEHWVYKINGVESNAWKLDPELRERTLAGKYR